jgi:2-keto-4-pentenoate hydratase/2-oxohepta-3-ene-1,7-dioic acid hydratase in catechol pathway
MLALIDADEAGLDAARGLFDRRGNEHDLVMEVADVELLAPLPEPRQMRDGMTFPLHIRQGPRGMRRIAAAGNAEALAAIEAEPLPDLAEVYRKVPIYYITNRLIVRGSGATIRWPRYSKVMDYELEFGVVTRRQGVNITAEKARDHIFGYTIFNDFSARDQQMIEMQGWLGPAKGKSFDGANVLGPWIVTPDEIGDPYKLKMQARVNGEVWSEGVSEGMLFSFEEMIAYMSRDETLHPGEFIGSGTVGNGCGLEHGRFLQHGDTIELEVERIGILKNRVERQDA